MTLEYKHESLSGFPRKLTPNWSRDFARFEKTWTQVLEILERELRMLGYRSGSTIIQTAHKPAHLRKDGMIRSNAPKPEHPGVVLRFEIYNSKQKRYEPMIFECDQFRKWKDNVRAIADAMEALRKVNRYGVSSQGQKDAHYRGYKALPETNLTKQGAAEFIAGYSQYPPHSLSDPEILEKAYKQAAKVLHPDSPEYNGNPENFIELQKAKEVLSN